MAFSCASRAPIPNLNYSRQRNFCKACNRARCTMSHARRWQECLVVCAIFLLSGCAQKMAVQPKVKPLAASSFFPDGQSARPLPPDTVAQSDVVNDDLLTTGKVNGQDATMFP